MTDERVFYVDRRGGAVSLCAHPVVDESGMPLPDQETVSEDAPLAQAILCPIPPDRITVPAFYLKEEAWDFDWTIGGATRKLIQWIEGALPAGSRKRMRWESAPSFDSDHPDIREIAAALGMSDADRQALFERARARVGNT